MELGAIKGCCLNVAHNAWGLGPSSAHEPQHLPFKISNVLFTFRRGGALLSPPVYCFPILFLPLKLLLNIIPHMYSLVFFQAESHFIVSCSYFLPLCRSLCIIALSSVGFATFSCPGSLANGLNKLLKPVPSLLLLPIYTEWSQFSGPPPWRPLPWGLTASPVL